MVLALGTWVMSEKNENIVFSFLPSSSFGTKIYEYIFVLKVKITEC